MGMFVHDNSEEDFIADTYEADDYTFKDELGGIHSEGEGWNPNGVWCGECSNVTCYGCHARYDKE